MNRGCLLTTLFLFALTAVHAEGSSLFLPSSSVSAKEYRGVSRLDNSCLQEMLPEESREEESRVRVIPPIITPSLNGFTPCLEFSDAKPCIEILFIERISDCNCFLRAPPESFHS